jgi:hypothetical protein
MAKPTWSSANSQNFAFDTPGASGQEEPWASVDLPDEADQSENNTAGKARYLAISTSIESVLTKI